DPYLALLAEAVQSTADLMVEWQAVGFCHGVLNTDNMSVLGLTIDYGPFGFMEKYDPKFISNHSDNTGRYSYENQPKICYWNLKKLAEALEPIVSKEETNMELNKYWSIFNEHYSNIMHKKLG